tara:strand:+ start:2340 stop:3026 length:687 start_codon:yes stop_codon:yes gene_type:complete
MPTQAELDVLNDASRKRQQARRGIEQPAEQQQAEEQEPYVNPYRSQYGTDSIEDNEYSQQSKDDGDDDYVNPYRSQYGTDSIEEEPRIGDEVNFDEISSTQSNDTQSIPDGRAYNDILFWNSEWSTLSPLASPESAQNLQIIDGDMEWVEFVEVPAGVSSNDILRWDGTDWVVLTAPAATGDFSLSASDGTMAWGDNIPDGYAEETIDYVTSGNTASSKIFLTKEVPV